MSGIDVNADYSAISSGMNLRTDRSKRFRQYDACSAME
jgi:hypothetical protein